MNDTLAAIQRRHWESCARDLRLPPQSLIDRAGAMIDRMTAELQSVAHALHHEGLEDPVIGKLVDAIDTHTQACRERLAGTVG